MDKQTIFFLPLLIAIGLGAILYTAIGKDPTKLETARLDDPIPGFNLPGLSEPLRTYSQSDLKGKVRLLNVWATWCPSCRVEHDYLLNLAASGVSIVGLNYKDDRVEALNWLKSLGDPYEFSIYDEQGRLGFDLGVYGAPETYVIDTQGLVRYRHVGVVNEKVWKQTIEPLFKKLNASTDNPELTTENTRTVN